MFWKFMWYILIASKAVWSKCSWFSGKEKVLQIVSYLVRKLIYCLFAFKRKTLIWRKNNCEVNLCSFDLKKKKSVWAKSWCKWNRQCGIWICVSGCISVWRQQIIVSTEPLKYFLSIVFIQYFFQIPHCLFLIKAVFTKKTKQNKHSYS